MSLVLEKLDRLDSRLDEQGRTLERLTTTVEIHEKRSTSLEAALAPIETHVAVVGGVAKAGAALGAGAIAVLGFLKTMGWL